MGGLANIFRGSLKAITNPKDIKGQLTGGYSNTKKMNEDEARQNRPAAAQSVASRPSFIEPGYSIQPMGRAPNSGDGEELLDDRNSAKKRLLGA